MKKLTSTQIKELSRNKSLSYTLENGFMFEVYKNIKSLADLDNLPAPDELAADIIENLQSALESFQELMGQLKKND